MQSGFRNRSNSYGRNLRLLKGASSVLDEDDTSADAYFAAPQSAAEQNKWLFEVAWEVANKGQFCSR